MESTVQIAGALCVLVFCVSCQNVHQQPSTRSSADKTAADVAAIRRFSERWQHAWETGDTDALADLYTDEPILMPQGMPAVVGKEAIHALYRSVLDEYDVAGGGEVLEIEVAGDWAYSRCTYDLTATPKAGGETLTDNGKHLFILRRQPNGEWKAARLIANSDRPPRETE